MMQRPRTSASAPAVRRSTHTVLRPSLLAPNVCFPRSRCADVAPRILVATSAATVAPSRLPVPGLSLLAIDLVSPADLGYPTNIDDVYDVLSDTLVGEGAFGRVFSAVHRTSGRHVAVKTLPKVRGQISRAVTMSKISKEIRLMTRVTGSAGVAELVAVYEDLGSVHIVQELCRGGDLKSYARTHGPLSEQQLSRVAFEVLSMLRGLHELGVVYGDVKLANFCLKAPGVLPDSAACADAGGGSLKTVDFGCSQQVSAATPRVAKRTGTLAYMAPEVFSKSMGFKCDVWSAGVMLHQLFAGRLPFWANDAAPRLTRVEEMAEIVASVPLVYDYGPWLGMSPEGRDFVARCLTRDEGARIGVADALVHPWLARHASSS
ncbi:hypothetical protein FOA52_007084 [Chlamydomonas sp. UWO 241]|nr:hypothetical protein FOA52_007084 [Chlamydomonas sp. UWO 241]